MKQKLTERELRGAVYERVQQILSEALDGTDSKALTSFILQPKYTNFIKTACHIIAWKGVDFDLNIRGNDYQIAKRMIDSYIAAKQEAMKSSNPKDNVARVKEAWRTKNNCEGLVDSEKEAFERFSQFKEEGYEFISKYLGNKTNSSKQMEKAAGLALFGKESDLSEFHIMHGAVFCVRDFFRWVNAGKPDFERTKAGKLKKGDSPLRQAGITGRIVNKDNFNDGSDSGENENSEFWRDVKAVLDNRGIDTIEMAKAIVGGGGRENQEDLKSVMLLISKYRSLTSGSRQSVNAFRTSAYDVMYELTDKIKELQAEQAIEQLLSGNQSKGDDELNEGITCDESSLNNEEKAQLVENSRKIKKILAESYDLADKIGEKRYKAIFGKILEFLLKSERDPARVEAMNRASKSDDYDE